MYHLKKGYNINIPLNYTKSTFNSKGSFVYNNIGKYLTGIIPEKEGLNDSNRIIYAFLHNRFGKRNYTKENIIMFSIIIEKMSSIEEIFETYNIDKTRKTKNISFY